MIVSLGHKTFKKRTCSIIRILLRHTDLPKVIAEEITVMAQQMEVLDMLEEKHSSNELGHLTLLANVDTLKQYVEEVKQNVGSNLHNFLRENYVWSPLNNAETFVFNVMTSEPVAYQEYLLHVDIVKNKLLSCSAEGGITGFLEAAKMVRKKLQDKASEHRHIQRGIDYFLHRLVEAVLMYDVTK